jgi:K+-sensing histidine kinase KdpD
VFDDRGRCTGDVVVVRDVSRQQELERLRSDFVARVSHELRTPLTPIRGFASVLLRRGQDLGEAQRSEALERIVERADHLGEVVEDLLLVTRWTAGSSTSSSIPSGGRLGGREGRRGGVAGLAPGAHVTLDHPRHRRRWPTRTAPADPAGVLDNAERYTPDDTPIEVEVDEVGDDVRVRVIDHGPGIPREHHESGVRAVPAAREPADDAHRRGRTRAVPRPSAGRGDARHLEIEPPRTGRGTVVVLRLPTAAPAQDAAAGHPFNTVGESPDVRPLLFVSAKR